MASIRKINCVLVLLVMVSTLLYSQDDGSDPSVQVSFTSRLYFDALSLLSEHSGEGRLDVYAEVPYEMLRFTKENDLFRASYDVTIGVYDSTQKLVVEKFWTEKIETPNYEESVSPKSMRVPQKSFSLLPGTYDVAVQVADRDTRKLVRNKKRVVVRDFSLSPVSMSDMMLVNSIDTVAGKIVISPNVSGNIADIHSGFYIFFEIYNHVKIDSAAMVFDVRDAKGNIVQSDTVNEAIGVERKSIFFRVKNSTMVAGEYLIDVTVIPLHQPQGVPKENMKASGSRPFVVRWRGMPISIVDLDLAIDELQYMADKEKIDEMKDAAPEKKRELFQKFWKQHDLTPNTERNEWMEEYYTRVEYANKHFSHYIDGWKTDMGMVYIIFGAPANIERHPFDIDAKPYEIWTYYQQSREFVFVDATGFGDYRLQNPIWDLWRTRPR